MTTNIDGTEPMTLLMRLARRQEQRCAQGRRIARPVKVLATVGALSTVSGVAYAYWTVTGTGSASAQSATVQNVSITATASPAAGNLLYPGGTGDAVAVISNPNKFPVTITDVQLPANTVFADGYTDSGLSSLKSGCSGSTPSEVTWNFSTSASGSSHHLTSAVTVAAGDGTTPGTLTVTLTNAASMDSSAPLACAGTYFKLPALTGVTATGGAATATTSPTTDSWTS